MTMSAMGPQYQRESVCELMFELFDVPQLYMEVPGYLSYTANFPSTEDAVVIESGAGVTNVIPIYKGQPDRKKIVNFGISGQDLGSYLSKLMQLRGYICDPKEEWKIVSHIKENISYVSPDFDDELKICKKDPNEFRQELEVRTGEKIILDSECFRCPEIMFDPTIVGINQPGIHELAFNAICAYPDIQNVVLSGGNMKIPGMVERIEREIKALAKQQGKKLKIKKPVLVDDFSAWKGMKILLIF
jgi:actin